MVSVGIKNLFQDWLRALISFTGVAVSITLILLLLGIYNGVILMSTEVVNNAGADIWVAQEGTNDMFHTFSLLPVSVKSQIEGIGGIDKVHELIGRAATAEFNTKNRTVYFLGYDTKEGVGGPWNIRKGKSNVKHGEVIIDRSLSHISKTYIGDTIKVNNVEFDVVGISDDTNALVFQYAFITLDDAAEVFDFNKSRNFFLVNVKNTDRAEKVVDRIEKKTEGIVAFTKKKFASKTEKVVTESFVPIIFTVVIIGFIIGVIVIGLTVYTATVEKTREYGVLKAIGANYGYLLKVVLMQSIITAIMGFILGSLFTAAASSYIQNNVPQVIIKIKDVYYYYTAAAAIIMSVLSAYLPIRKISKIDPAIVFRV